MKLRERYDLHFIGVAGNSKMESKIQQALSALRAKVEGGKSILVAFTAQSRAANKCIGVTEIVKREFVKEKGDSLYQYTGCWTRLETHVPKDQGKGHMKTAGQEVEEGEEDEDDAFEAADTTERKQVRNVTCMVVYLSLQPVPRLRDKYGEQVHEAEKG